MILHLPWPPSVNHYWRSVRIGPGCRVLISARGRAYRREVWAACLEQRAREQEGRLEVVAVLHPPDRRRWDLDNRAKAMLDGMQAAGVYADDAQIDRLVLERGERVQGGRVDVDVRAMEVAT